ncbi:MAG: DUF4838 domain-containing protein [Phycisphaerales bacterium]
MANAAKWIAMVMLLVVSGALAQDGAAPLVKNGGFESDKTGWWGPGASQVVKEGAVEGAACLKLTSQWLCQDKIKIEGGKRYRIVMRIRSDNAPDNSIYVQLSYRGGGLEPQWYGPNAANLGDHSELVLYATGGTHAWKEFAVVVQTPARADQALIYLRRSSNDGAGYFDNIRMEPTEAPVTAPSAAARSGGGGHDGIANGGFENGQASWWGPGLQNSAGQIMKENAAEGSACLKLTSQWVCQDKINVEGGKNYRISMKVRCDQVPDGAAFVQMSFRGESVDPGWRGPYAAHHEPAIVVTGGTHEWKEFSTVVEAPAGADQMLIYLRKQGDAGAVYYDDVKMEATDVAAMTAAMLQRDAMAAKWFAPVTDAASAQAVIEKVLQSANTKTDLLTLADQGKTTYRIYVGDKTDVVSLNAAVELAENIEKITGAKFGPFAHDTAPSDQPLLVIGRDNALTRKLCPDIPYDALGHDGFVIRTVGPNIVITGATPRGTLYGVYWLLDHHLGVKWFDPDFTVIPSKSTLTVKAINEQQTPRFTYREVFSSEAHNDRYAAHNLLNGRSHGRSYSPSAAEINDWEDWYEVNGGVANFWDLLNRKENLKTHPEWFTGGQVAMLNEQVRQTSAETIIGMLKKLKDYRSVVFHINDMDWGWDMDPASKAFADQHGGEPSAPRLDMVIDVANRVRKVFPEARFSFNAYHWSFTPPTGMTVPDYIIVNPMDIQVDYSSPIFKGPNKKLGEDIVGWTKIANHVLMWDHTVNFFGYLQPTPNLYPICQSIQWLATLKPVMGYFCEDSWNTPGAEFAVLRTWVIARLLWNPNQDYMQVIGEFVNGYYGDAAPYILKYIDLSHESMVKSGDTFREKTTVMSDYLNLDFLMAADKLFEQAHDAVANQPDFLKHVQTTRLAVDYTILVRRFDLMDTAKARGIAWNPDTAHRMERLYHKWDMAGVRVFTQERGSLADLKQLLSIERKTPSKPDLAKGLADDDWRDYQDLCLTRYGAVIVTDNAASDGAAIRLDGNNSVWAAQFRRYKLPKEGKWDVYVAVRVDRGTGDQDTDPAVNVGSSPPMGHFNTAPLGELSDGQYHWVKVFGSPLTYAPEDEKIVYIQPRNNDSVKYIYVDRIVAIRYKD